EKHVTLSTPPEWLPSQFPKYQGWHSLSLAGQLTLHWYSQRLSITSSRHHAFCPRLPSRYDSVDGSDLLHHNHVFPSEARPADRTIVPHGNNSHFVRWAISMHPYA